MNLYDKIAYLKKLKVIENGLDQRLDSLMRELVNLTEQTLESDPDQRLTRIQSLKAELTLLEEEEHALLEVVREIHGETDEILDDKN